MVKKTPWWNLLFSMDGGVSDFSKHGEISTGNLVVKLNLIFFNMKNPIFVEIGRGENF